MGNDVRIIYVEKWTKHHITGVTWKKLEEIKLGIIVLLNQVKRSLFKKYLYLHITNNENKKYPKGPRYYVVAIGGLTDAFVSKGLVRLLNYYHNIGYIF